MTHQLSLSSCTYCSWSSSKSIQVFLRLLLEAEVILSGVSFWLYTVFLTCSRPNVLDFVLNLRENATLQLFTRRSLSDFLKSFWNKLSGCVNSSPLCMYCVELSDLCRFHLHCWTWPGRLLKNHHPAAAFLTVGFAAYKLKSWSRISLRRRFDRDLTPALLHLLARGSTFLLNL